MLLSKVFAIILIVSCVTTLIIFSGNRQTTQFESSLKPYGNEAAAIRNLINRYYKQRDTLNGVGVIHP